MHLQTPRLHPFLPSTPSQLGKTARMPLRHESIMSVNGSPLVNQVEDVTGRRGTRIIAHRESSVISVPLMEGQQQFEIQMDSGQTSLAALEGLDGEAREQVMQQLKRLNEQLTQLVEAAKTKP
jgi:hypothetical protein